MLAKLARDEWRHQGSQGLNRYSYGMNNPMSGSDPSGFGWLANISVGDAVGAAVIAGHAVSYGILLGNSDSLAGASPTSAGSITTGSIAGGGLGVGQAAYGLATSGNGGNAAPTGELGGGAQQATGNGLYNESAGAPPRLPLSERGALVDGGDTYAPHYFGPNYQEHVTSTEEAWGVVAINAAYILWEAIPALFNSATALTFGTNDLVLGLNGGGALQQFVQRFGGKTFGQFASAARTFPGQIRDALTQATRVRVNLSGIDLSRISGALNEFGEPAAGYTNYELWLIKNTPEFLSKTSFYKNGAEVASPF